MERKDCNDGYKLEEPEGPHWAILPQDGSLKEASSAWGGGGSGHPGMVCSTHAITQGVKGIVLHPMESVQVCWHSKYV